MVRLHPRPQPAALHAPARARRLPRWVHVRHWLVRRHRSRPTFAKHGAAITDDAGKHTPFVAAFLWRKYAVARWFLENGAEVDTPDEHGHTALYYAVKRKFPDEMIAMLLDFGADPDRPGADGVSPRGYALEKRQRKMLNLLSRSAASP